MNKSQELIIGTIVTAMLGIPNIQSVFTEAVITITLNSDPSSSMIIIISILKLLLALTSIWWFIELAKNAEFTYKMHSQRVFENYTLTLVLTGGITFVIILFLRALAF